MSVVIVRSQRALGVPAAAILGFALMSLSVALVALELADERAARSCVSLCGSFLGLAVLVVVVGLWISILESTHRRPDLQPPNPRLQRTPSASPPSPLSRQPLGGDRI